MRRAINLISVALFFLILWAPTLQVLLHWVHYDALSENRNKITRPNNWKLLFEAGGVFAKKYEDYYNDNYGLRDLLVRFKNQLDFQLFHQSEQVLIGPDHWLFYKSVVEVEEIGIERTPPENYEMMFAHLIKLNNDLASRGITLVVVPCPMKNTIYPEFVPVGAPSRPTPTGFDRYRQFLRDHPEIQTVDTVPILMELKKTSPVFHKTDFHWNDFAGAAVAQALVDRLGNLSHVGNLWDQHITTFRQNFTRGGENNSLALFRPIVEDALFLEPESLKPEEGKSSGDPTRPNRWIYETDLKDTSRLIPPTVLFGDSYSDAFMRAHFMHYFSRIQKLPVPEFETEYKSIPPGTRFVIFQHIEPALGGMLTDGFWPAEIAKTN